MLCTHGKTSRSYRRQLILGASSGKRSGSAGARAPCWEWLGSAWGSASCPAAAATAAPLTTRAQRHDRDEWDDVTERRTGDNRGRDMSMVERRHHA